jgi:hypothetical protein
MLTRVLAWCLDSIAAFKTSPTSPPVSCLARLTTSLRYSESSPTSVFLCTSFNP